MSAMRLLQYVCRVCQHFLKFSPRFVTARAGRIQMDRWWLKISPVNVEPDLPWAITKMFLLRCFELKFAVWKSLGLRKSTLSWIQSIYKQLLDEVFVISGIIKVEVSVISRSRRLRLITLTFVLRRKNKGTQTKYGTTHCEGSNTCGNVSNERVKNSQCQLSCIVESFIPMFNIVNGNLILLWVK